MKFWLFHRSGVVSETPPPSARAIHVAHLLAREEWLGMRIVDDIADDHPCRRWSDAQERAIMRHMVNLAPPRCLS